MHQSISADYQAGLDAYNDGNYKTAMYEWKVIAAGPPVAVSRPVLAETNYAIGMLYWQGQGVTADYAEAFNWLQKAANMGHAGAQDKLGYLYTEGTGVAQDYATAFEWFKKAAEQGSVDGQYNLGIFYLNGWGTEQDVTMAAQYLAAASAQGDVAAEQELQKLLPMIANSKRGDLVAADVEVEAEAEAKEQARATEAQAIEAQAINAEVKEEQAIETRPMEAEAIAAQAIEAEAETDLQTQPVLLPESWVLEQNPNSYTIQVIGLRSKSDIENLINYYKYMAPFACYTLQRNNKPLYMLVQGAYPNVEAARAARDNFPKAIQKPKEVWIRQFGKVQELIRSPK